MLDCFRVLLFLAAACLIILGMALWVMSVVLQPHA